MKAPACSALLVSGDRAWRDGRAEALNLAAVREPASPARFRLEVAGADGVDALLAVARDDPRLQAVIVDAGTIPDVRQAMERLRRLRPELDLFVAADAATQARADLDGIDAAVVDRDETAVSGLLRRLYGAIGRRARTPFADTLRDYVYSARDAWHTPGHSGGDALRESPWVSDFYTMMGEHIFNTDLSVSVQSLDSLLDPHSVIREAQALAAEAFGAAHSFFVTNGTSTANRVILQYLAGNGGKLLVDQACHKSIHHGITLLGCEPVYLPASVNQRYGIYGPVCRQRITAALDDHPDARLLVLTACTYDGLNYDLAPIVAEAHDRGVKVLVDEAWYAHGHFHPAFRPGALEAGADYVTQSTHKTLSAFSQASMIHVGDPDFDEGRFREHLNMHLSTSPQYAMIASLDVARKQVSLEGYGLLSRSLGFAAMLREGIDGSGVFRVLGLEDLVAPELAGQGVRLDPTKLTIDTVAWGDAHRLQRQLFERFGIQVEKATHSTLTVLVTPGTTRGKCLRLVKALRSLAGERRVGAEASPAAVPLLPPLAPVACAPREAFFAPAHFLPLAARDGGPNPALPNATSCDMVVPYPPGIPVLVPGQRVSEAVVRFLLELSRAGDVELHGLARKEGRPGLRVRTGDEDTRRTGHGCTGTDHRV